MPLLEIDDLHVRYGAAEAVRGLSLAVSPGEILAVLGPNGAGKTSTLRGVMGLEPGAKRTLELDGVNATKWSTTKLARSGIALIPQGRRVFASLSVEENLMLGAYASRDRTQAAATLARCFDWFPVLADRRAQRSGYLSGGEQQMLAFGRAMMSDPKAILMDEPSMGLAPIVVEEIMSHARQIADSGIAVVMVEQNAVAATAVADNVVVLNLGAEVFRGTVAEARNNAEVVKAFLGDAALIEDALSEETT